MMFTATTIRFVILLLSAVATLCAQDRRTVWDGVYTAEQADRGQASYAVECARCHRDDLAGYNSALVGTKFMERWTEDSLFSFADLVQRTMPRNAPASLPKNRYTDIVAYVLKFNGFPAGTKELTWEELKPIRIQAKEGPQEVPNFSLVTVVGCLAPKNADGNWVLNKATEPVRTRDPKDSADDEKKTLAAKSLGKHDFTLLDPAGVQPNPPVGHKVEVKGFLIRQAAGDKLNPTSLQSLAPSCN
jgi:mono/diheme cytochrome c family protein